MTNWKNANWDLDNTVTTVESASMAVLLDIRSELRKLNGILGCHNFLDIPFKLDTIKRNTTKPRKKKK